jgi:FtsP/CotA-like multicopper oxidase with cupredoxin domain
VTPEQGCFESRRKELLVEISSPAYATLNPTELDNFKNPLRLPGDEGVMGVLDASEAPLRFTVQHESVEILPGKRTGLWAYRAERDGRTYINPTVRVQKGKEFSAEFANDLDEETTVHWHGLHVDWRMDGHPFRPVAPGSTYRYAFPVQERGGTYWYHPHPHGGTARQTYAGLAGFFLVEDEDQQRLAEALDLRLGETDIPLLIQDKVLDESGSFVYEPDSMAVHMGYEGDVILVNLTPTPYLEVSTRIYRFRLLNGSNARTYRLAFTKAGEEELLPYQIIGTDGGLLNRPHSVNEVFLSPAERVDVLFDLSSFEVGEEVVLKSLPFDPMHHEHEMEMSGDMQHMGHMEHMEMGHHHHMDHQMGPARLPDGSEFYLLKLAVNERTDYTRRAPEKLSEIPQPDFAEASSRPITISMTTDDQAMRWLINGRTHSMDEFPIVVQRCAKEIWEIHNDEMSMPHPAHLHGFQFQVLERAGTPEQVTHLVVDEKGRLVTDLGFKDTVLLWPGETVKWAIDFSHEFEGEQIYMFHCHILEHETALMLNLKID